MKIKRALKFLKLHHDAFFEAKPYADETKHPPPRDTRSWSQILISLLTGINGIASKKGADLEDGSDVKGANTWGAIDTPRFNGVIKAGTKSLKAGKIEYLDDLPFLFFVLWDNEPEKGRERCRVWVVRPKEDSKFRNICEKWYIQRINKTIISWNFQLHPPRGKNTDIFTNKCGNLNYPLFFCAEWVNNKYVKTHFNVNVLKKGLCTELHTE